MLIPKMNSFTIAYFSMEIGLSNHIPTYSGGLGVLAGDTIRSAADIGVPLIAVTLLHRNGYFHQHLDKNGMQSEEPVAWPIDDFLTLLDTTTTVEIEGRSVKIRVWKYEVTGVTGQKIPVYFLDTDVPENSPEDRELTNFLYGGDKRYRLCQEVVLGIGGFKMLRALGYDNIAKFHLNEGHAALLTLALLEEQILSSSSKDTISENVLESVRSRCVFTTHTPVPAGHDRFSVELAQQVLGAQKWHWLNLCEQTTELNMTDLALHCSQFINGVAMKHGEISRSMYPGYPIRSITNGVHTATWAAPSFQSLYDERLPDWRSDPMSLRYAVSIPKDEIWQAHLKAKRELMDYANREANVGFDKDMLTIGFARRATAYKRGALILSDLERLKAIAEKFGQIQIVFAGKAHPHDEEGKEIIKHLYKVSKTLRGQVKAAYLSNYDMELARLLCAGVDVWLNTPLPPMEASGTSGMKAAVNGVPSLSVLDGWWIEGWVEGVTGWAIGNVSDADDLTNNEKDARDADSLYSKLETTVLPCFYQQQENFIEIMRHTIALNGSFFNSHRMLNQYLIEAYQLLEKCFNNNLGTP
jgi:starch phosphorylase